MVRVNMYETFRVTVLINTVTLPKNNPSYPTRSLPRYLTRPGRYLMRLVISREPPSLLDDYEQPMLGTTTVSSRLKCSIGFANRHI